MANKLCKQCNLREVNRPGKTFCSRQCYWESRKGQPSNCPIDVLRANQPAGVEAARHFWRGKTQSPEHLQRRLASMAHTLANTVRQCKLCNEPFTPTHAVQIYCSGRCWKAVNRKKRPRPPAFSIPIGQYRAMMASQNGRCAICGGTQKHKLAVDHCHETMVVRGLLCHRCNMALGVFTTDALLQSAREYLLRSKRLNA
jgi:recombination endonuclease VII